MPVRADHMLPLFYQVMPEWEWLAVFLLLSPLTASAKMNCATLNIYWTKLMINCKVTKHKASAMAKAAD